MEEDIGNAPPSAAKGRGQILLRNLSHRKTNPKHPHVSGTNTARLDLPGVLGVVEVSSAASAVPAQSTGTQSSPLPQPGEDLTWKLFFSPLLWLSISRALWLSWGVWERGGLHQDRSTRKEGVRCSVTPWDTRTLCPGVPQPCPRGCMGQCCHSPATSVPALIPSPLPTPLGSPGTCTETTGSTQGVAAGFGLNPHQPGRACPAVEFQSWSLGFSKHNLGWRPHGPSKSSRCINGTA